MNEDLADYFVSHCNFSDHFTVPWDGLYVPEDDSYDYFLSSGANFYGGVL